MSPGAAVADRHVRKPLRCPLVRPEVQPQASIAARSRRNLTISSNDSSLPTTQAMAAEGRGQMFTDAPIFDADQHMYESPEALTRYLPERCQRAAQFVRAISASRSASRPRGQGYPPSAPPSTATPATGTHCGKPPAQAGDHPTRTTHSPHRRGPGTDQPPHFRLATSQRSWPKPRRSSPRGSRHRPRRVPSDRPLAPASGLPVLVVVGQQTLTHLSYTSLRRLSAFRAGDLGSEHRRRDSYLTTSSNLA